MIPLAVTFSPGLNNGSELDSDFKKEKVEKYLERMAEKEAFETRNFIYSVNPSPKYSTDGGECSAYVRDVGKDFYGKDYFFAHAWDRKHLDNLIYSFSSQEDSFEKLKELEKKGIFNKGMVLGVWHRPPRNSEKDIYGNKADYSHNVIFRGIDSETGKYIFDHEWGNKQDTISLSSMRKKGWKIHDLIDENPVAYAEAVENYSSKKS